MVVPCPCFINALDRTVVDIAAGELRILRSFTETAAILSRQRDSGRSNSWALGGCRVDKTCRVNMQDIVRIATIGSLHLASSLAELLHLELEREHTWRSIGPTSQLVLAKFRPPTNTARRWQFASMERTPTVN